MSQFDFGDLESPLPGETFINGNLEPWRDALHSSHMGDDRPSYAAPGMLWIDNSETPWVAKVFQGSNDIVLGTLDPSTLVFTPSILPSAFGAAYAVLKMNAAGDGLEYGLVGADNLTSGAATDGQVLTADGAGGVAFEDAAAPVTKQIGEVFAIQTNITGSAEPDNSGTEKYIKLTSGLTGAGQYNEGLLTNESVSGSAPLVQATAEIVGGPMDGQTVRLWNTEGRYPKPGTSAGTVANDQMQTITGAVNSILGGSSIGLLRASSSLAGAFTSGGSTTETINSAGSAGRELDFNSASSPSARTGTSTDVKHEQTTYFMRII